MQFEKESTFFVKGTTALAQKYAVLLDLWNILCLETRHKCFFQLTARVKLFVFLKNVLLSFF